MKRIFSYLFAIITLMGTTGVFTSCQEDAPAINYTINVTVNNDFTEVVNAINNGTMKQEAAIAALTAAIEKMQGDQDSKQQAIADAINSLASTLDAKLAIIEAAMKAQTLALETKLDLLEAAIKALPDYTDQLQAIETALEAIAANIEAQEGQYADELAALTESIDAIKSEVAAGNKSQEDALAEIIALLKSGAIAGGGSGSGGEGEGSGSGEGEGEGSGEGEGEGSGDETSYVTLTFGVFNTWDEIHVRWTDAQGGPTTDLIEGSENVTISVVTSGEYKGYYRVKGYRDLNATVKIKGDIIDLRVHDDVVSVDVSHAKNLLYLNLTNNEISSLDVSQNVNLKELYCNTNKLTSLDVSKNVDLEILSCGENQLKSLDVSQNKKLYHLSCQANNMESLSVSNEVAGGYEFLTIYYNHFSKEVLDDVISKLPTAGRERNEINLHNTYYGPGAPAGAQENNELKDSHIDAAKAKGYKVYTRKGDDDWKER